MVCLRMLKVCYRHQSPLACAGVAVAASVIGALDAGRGFFGSLMRQKGDEQSTGNAADSTGGTQASGDQDAD